MIDWRSCFDRVWRASILLIACTAFAGCSKAAEGDVPRDAVEQPALGPAPAAGGGSALGDWGHFLSFRPRLHVLNENGGDFNLTFHLMLWPARDWTPTEVSMRVLGPEGEPVLWRTEPVEGNEIRLTVPADGRGVYTVDWGLKSDGSGWDGGNFWMETSLPSSVLWTGDARSIAGEAENAIEKRRPVFQASVPRRWWFWVPPDVVEFKIKAQRMDRYMSQREDWGISVFSPRGQRMDVLWGQPPKTTSASWRQEMERTIEVEPGAAGRFWYVEVRNGDSHHHSKINFTLEGVPPYVARSAEEWFDADTGERPNPLLYDESVFVQALHELGEDPRRPNLQHWSPVPSLGDPDGTMVRGTARVALNNAEGRDLRLVVADYIPRGASLRSAGATGQLEVRAQGESEAVVRQIAVPHYHGEVPRPQVMDEISRPGVHWLRVDELERWWAFTLPAVPMVLAGQNEKDGGSAFSLEIGSARNWYFYVPSGTRSFEVGVRCEHETDVIDLEVNAPDRVVARIYANEDAVNVRVPAGMDGKLWHLRTDVGSASRFVTRDSEHPRYLGIYLHLRLREVPGYLAPTPDQWFDPRSNGRDL